MNEQAKAEGQCIWAQIPAKHKTQLKDQLFFLILKQIGGIEHDVAQDIEVSSQKNREMGKKAIPQGTKHPYNGAWLSIEKSRLTDEYP